MSLDPEVRRGGNLPFGMVASVWMCDPRYSTNARTLYPILVTYADTQARNTRKGKPYRKELAAQLGVSVSTVDRTLVEMEVAGMVTIEARIDPKNPANNEANIYHLHDAPLMFQGNGTWTDPLPSGVKAADVAKELIEQRRAEKRQQGVERRGGVPKGVSSKAVKEARKESPGKAPEEGGGSTGAARGGSTDAATRAARMLPNIQNPFQTPSPEPLTTDGRRPGAGSRGQSSGGSAASGKSKPRSLTPQEGKAYASFAKALPPELAELLPKNAPRDLKLAVIEAMDLDGPAERTAEQLVAFRLMPKWDKHYSSRDAAGAIIRPVGVLRAMLRRDAECGDDRCDERVNVDSGEACRSCEMRAVNRRADRENAKEHPSVSEPDATVPTPRPVAPSGPARGKCGDCSGLILIVGPAVKDGLCSDCRRDRSAALAPF